MKYKRALLKISGQILGDKNHLFAPLFLDAIATEIKEIIEGGIQLALVAGGGNIIRGTESEKLGIDRVTGDYMGMLATVINSLALQNILEKKGLKTRVQSAIAMSQIAEPFIRRRAMRHLEKERVVIFSCGTGNPYFSTDTAAVLRAVEIGAEVFLKGTRVDGVYSGDPAKDPDCVRYNEIDYDTILNKNLRILDAAAVALCRENSLPIIVFNLTKRGELKSIFQGKPAGTIVHSTKTQRGF